MLLAMLRHALLKIIGLFFAAKQPEKSVFCTDRKWNTAENLIRTGFVSHLCQRLILCRKFWLKWPLDAFLRANKPNPASRLSQMSDNQHIEPKDRLPLYLALNKR